MKKFMVAVVCIGLGTVFILDSAGMKAAVYDSVILCLNTIVPSLFAFLALSTFVVSSGLVKSNIAVFMLSIAGGYPIGAKLLSAQAAANPEHKRRCENMMMYCFCGSPALLVAITDYGIYVWASNAIACSIFAIICNLRKNSELTNVNVSTPHALKSESFIYSVASAGNALYHICLTIIAFSVILRTLEFVGVMRLLPDFAYAFIEITNLVDIKLSPAVTAGVASMGGLCILFQIKAICKKHLRLHKFILARIPIAILSGIICHLLTRNIVVETIVENAVSPLRAEASSGGSIIASACLVIMSVMLLQTQKSPSSCK